MNLFECTVKLAVYGAMAVSLLAAIGVVTTRNLFHAALALIFSLLGVAAIYVSLKAEFLAIIQILLYVGAIMVLIIFTIMLTEKLSNRFLSQTNKFALPTFLTLVAFAYFLIQGIRELPWGSNPESLTASMGALELGIALMGPYVLPFEISSMVLIIALIGAIVLGRSEK